MLILSLSLLLSVQELAFREVAASSGLRTVNVYGGVERKRYILETTGTGALFFDYDEDGDQDLYLVNGARVGETELQAPSSELYRNDGAGGFTNVTGPAGLEARGWGQGAAATDVDNDGDLDLLVTYYGPNRFYRNNGDGTFAERAAAAGLDDRRWSTSAAFADYDRDGVDDLFVAAYVDFDEAATPEPGGAPNCFFMGLAVMCGPRGLPPAQSVLYRGRGDGTFEDQSGSSDVGAERYYGLGAVWGDLDDDGDVDLYVANDQTPNNLFENDGRGRFTDVALPAGVAFNEDGRAQAGMGVDLGDIDNDGYLDIHVTNFSSDYNTLYRNTGEGYFLDVSFAAGLGEASYLYLGWGTGFHDFDRNGFLDLFVANGHVYPEVASAEMESDYRQRNLLFLNDGAGRFREVGATLGESFEEPRAGRGAAFADYDDDGDVDVLVANMNALPSLFRNDLPPGANWVGFRLVGRTSGRAALGARVTVVSSGGRQIREVRSGGSYLSQSDLRPFFGFGEDETLDEVEIRWPLGTVQTLRGVAPGRYVTVVEPR